MKKNLRVGGVEASTDDFVVDRLHDVKADVLLLDLLVVIWMSNSWHDYLYRFFKWQGAPCRTKLRCCDAAVSVLWTLGLSLRHGLLWLAWTTK